jgi:hypothetical protein
VAGSGIGLRNERVRIYTRTDGGSDGFARPVYTFLAERWGRVAYAGAQFRLGGTPAAAYDTRYDALATFADEITLPTDGLLLAGGEVFYLRGTVRSTLLRRQTVRLERVSAETFARFTLFEGDSVHDGTHLVDS